MTESIPPQVKIDQVKTFISENSNDNIGSDHPVSLLQKVKVATEHITDSDM